MLVDFDWPAKDEEGKYPAVLNPWSEDVLPYGIMRKSHDLWQSAVYFSSCREPFYKTALHFHYSI
jgi:hypothetical protein